MQAFCLKLIDATLHLFYQGINNLLGAIALEVRLKRTVVDILRFFLLLAMNKPIAKVTGAVTCAEGALTGWLPGYLLLEGYMGPAAVASATASGG